MLFRSDGRVTAGEASDAVRGRVDGNIDEGGSTVPDKPSDPGDGGDTGSNPGNGASYTVRSGDTLSGIAAANNMSLDALISANPQISNPNLIYPGQSINLSGDGGRPSSVRTGETMPRTPARPGLTLPALN